MTLDLVIQLAILGCTVGFLAGLFGIGGGGLMVPIFTSIFISQGFPVDKVVHIALGTSMASIIATSLASCNAHHKNNNILWSEAKVLSIGVSVGAFCATFLVSILNSLFLAIFFSAYMAYISLQMFRNQQPKVSATTHRKRGMITSGIGIGIISSMVSIGGGSLTVPYLMRKGFSIKKAIGTSAAVGVPISIAGSIGFLINGNLDIKNSSQVLGFIHWPSVLIISIFTATLAPLGANVAHRLPVKMLKRYFGILLIFLSVKMLAHVVINA